MTNIENLNIPYPDFKLNETIDPEEFDANNLAIKNKVDELVSNANTYKPATELEEEITSINDDIARLSEIKLDITGDFKGTWNGVSIQEAGQGGIDGARLNVLEGRVDALEDSPIDAIAPLQREVAHLKLKQEAGERIDGGSLYGDKFDGNPMDMTPLTTKTKITNDYPIGAIDIEVQDGYLINENEEYTLFNQNDMEHVETLRIQGNTITLKNPITKAFPANSYLTKSTATFNGSLKPGAFITTDIKTISQAQFSLRNSTSATGISSTIALLENGDIFFAIYNSSDNLLEFFVTEDGFDTHRKIAEYPSERNVKLYTYKNTVLLGIGNRVGSYPDNGYYILEPSTKPASTLHIKEVAKKLDFGDISVNQSSAAFCQDTGKLHFFLARFGTGGTQQYVHYMSDNFGDSFDYFSFVISGTISANGIDMLAKGDKFYFFINSQNFYNSGGVTQSITGGLSIITNDILFSGLGSSTGYNYVSPSGYYFSAIPHGTYGNLWAYFNESDEPCFIIYTTPNVTLYRFKPNNTYEMGIIANLPNSNYSAVTPVRVSDSEFVFVVTSTTDTITGNGTYRSIVFVTYSGGLYSPTKVIKEANKQYDIVTTVDTKNKPFDGKFPPVFYVNITNAITYIDVEDANLPTTYEVEYGVARYKLDRLSKNTATYLIENSPIDVEGYMNSKPMSKEYESGLYNLKLKEVF